MQTDANNTDPNLDKNADGDAIASADHEPKLTFNDILEQVEALVEELDAESQEMIFDLVKKRRNLKRREEIARTIAQAEENYRQGKVFRGTVEEIMAELNR
ncbi:hypothetical protein Pse7367_3864 (plasmid) [Thalassoporum mexicanum PCC 7367]|uniref:hypothetical protein n=1 Tax=Thalassoporum mexicanum TaxID=3457544 RepID=UPI00029FDE6F|nr:hypothetical protein [Pseudanabaena sp. PCC 7367]AFY72087.1 hypothetical protein Pse7367_3864 [Pseudanabaena sp. PCC 7367]